jgi:hypothetical protein
MISTEIGHGPDHTQNISDFAGESWWDIKKNAIASNVYLSPTWGAYKLQDGRILKIIDRCGCSTVQTFNNYEEFRLDEQNRYNMMPDPESGRYRK